MSKHKKITEVGDETVLVRAQDSSSSLRTTVPKGIVNQFALKEGDHINWKIKPGSDGIGLVLVIEKVGDKNGEK